MMALPATVRAALRWVWEEQHWLELYCDSDGALRDICGRFFVSSCSTVLHTNIGHKHLKENV
jgi:hypothetical protein